MDLIRTSLLTAISTAIKLVSAFAINKVVAVVAGPAGMALIGQVQNVASILQGTSSGLFSTAAVKHSAEWRDQPARRERFLSLSYTLAVWLTLIVGTTTGLLSWWLAGALLNDHHYWWVFAMLGVSIPLFVANNLVLSVINGLGNVKKLTALNIAESIFGLIISVGLPLLFGVPGALAATVLASAVVFVLLLPELRRHSWLKMRMINRSQDKSDLARLKGFAVMAMASAICAPLAQLIAREWIVEHCSLREAGYWQGLMRFSAAYLMFFTTTLSVYFLPKFSSLDVGGIKRELTRAYALLLPTLLILFAGIWLSRGWLISLLFSREFSPIESLVGYQLIGDFLKIGSWMMAFLMLARARTLRYVVSEIAFNILYVLLVVKLVGTSGSGGARGAVLAWIGLYAAYWLFLIVSLPAVLRGDATAVAANLAASDGGGGARD